MWVIQTEFLKRFLVFLMILKYLEKKKYHLQCDFVLSILTYLIPWFSNSIWSSLAFGSSNSSCSIKSETRSLTSKIQNNCVLAYGKGEKMTFAFPLFPPSPETCELCSCLLSCNVIPMSNWNSCISNSLDQKKTRSKDSLLIPKLRLWEYPRKATVVYLFKVLKSFTRWI